MVFLVAGPQWSGTTLEVTVPDVHVVVGGQFGSEAKGAVTAKIAADFDKNDMVVRVAGPNAGHTAYDKDGREWKLRTVPVGAVASPTCKLHLAAGSEIDLEVLIGEITELEDAGHDVMSRLSIHPSATILEPRHQSVEGQMGIVGRIGSTGKGIGAARADRIMRAAMTFGEWAATGNKVISPIMQSAPGPLDIERLHRVVIEGTQGYGLGLHTANYPQVTSSDCRAIDFLAMAGVSPWDLRVDLLEVWIVARCFPIRVAGNSGPLKGETTWEGLGLPPERTTVTNKIRRVGEWDDDLLAEAIRANGGGDWHDSVRLAITMLDQKFPEVAGATVQTDLTLQAIKWLNEIEERHETSIDLVGTGPQSMIRVNLS